MSSLEHRHTTRMDGPTIQLDDYAVIGPAGAVSAWWSDTRAIIGHRVCSGVGLHSLTPRDGWTQMDDCPYLGAPCWTELLSSMGQSLLYEELADRGPEAIFGYLEAHYEEEWPA